MNGTMMKSSLDFNKSIAKRKQRSLSNTKPRSIVSRNQDLSSTCNTFKETTQCSPDKSVYLQNYLMLNSNGNYDTFYSIKNQKNRFAQNLVPQYQKQNGSKNEINHYMPVHSNQMHLIRNKKYTEERVPVDIQTGEILKKQNYQQMKEQNANSISQVKRNRIYSTQNSQQDTQIDLNRQNLYISNYDKDLRVNQDIIKNKNIRHVSVNSDGSPDWFKTSMGFFSKPFVQGKVYTYAGPQFNIIPQNQKSVYQDLKIKNNSSAFNDCSRRERTNIQEIKKDTLKMRWDVSDNERSFRVTQKVGATINYNQNDTIRNNVYRRQQTDLVSDKIGSSPRNSSLLKQQRPIQIKIGHNSFVNTQQVF
ncbi:hypothetical protein TTHERM_00624320 (macronuclear) [Tetrahymena thermophila SB210]|uniref:Uncharacterized protein n=1 Tax=Tetrahymena thermophila (strain SB210) TaxID=312017 RepID=Q240V1_TETTS|nr:hypothetical protein TTHERM_00624320 [Tetrahymena thermophila SB210]EAS02313.2 hypothetical protein TTHERM_00624320 [Tetrahymena thermophila SB210]|eukprot:XP_001022558.2 hypothetical protein TTHERM_00624320 [Tetrahymena thermophila SB210]